MLDAIGSENPSYRDELDGDPAVQACGITLTPDVQRHHVSNTTRIVVGVVIVVVALLLVNKYSDALGIADDIRTPAIGAEPVGLTWSF